MDVTSSVVQPRAATDMCISLLYCLRILERSQMLGQLVPLCHIVVFHSPLGSSDNLVMTPVCVCEYVEVGGGRVCMQM